ncbi:MAG: hypothetical protein KF833_17230 [Verrucomicrobiae bacterium]|nr:hypothetical protein [Verrucomicrobiae bacterium]
MSKAFPPRLHVILARDAKVAVVFRRGPSKSVCTMLWDRKRDTFRMGQWFRGRVYERRADLSADGKFLIYFAMNGRPNTETGGSWTAISRTPWMKAIGLLGKGDCWHGGGLFTGDRQYWLNDGYGHRSIRDSSQVRRDTTYQPARSFGGECLNVYYPRLLRDGWNLIEERGHRMDSATVFERPLGHGWVLRKIAHEQVGAPEGKGCYWDEHELVHNEKGAVLQHPDWEWADRDGDSVLWGNGGCLYRARINRSHGVGTPKVLHDFNEMKFEAIPAPY